MDTALQLELYTRPTCSDCQDAKKYLKTTSVLYVNKDVGANLDLEQEMVAISGNRIVPLFVFYKKGMLRKRRVVKYFVGFENNKEEILTLLR
ncbi:glutaredoxin domain-containing protein [Exiguobacterium sp. s46]|uniref:glutaredoxin family protein n=1 Tax=Exiguobacterium sp. s46 TaxID=2751200 RepID=UPI001BE696D8|nr:glutaredoxin domain-containing protein [Exiguobacterium sp. s46]